MDKFVSLGFIQVDVNRQLRTSRDILDAVRQLNELEGKLSIEQRPILRQIADRLARAAETLIDNAATTGKTVATLLGAA